MTLHAEGAADQTDHYAPTLEKVKGLIAFGLSVRPWVRSKFLKIQF